MLICICNLNTINDWLILMIIYVLFLVINLLVLVQFIYLLVSCYLFGYLFACWSSTNLLRLKLFFFSFFSFIYSLICLSLFFRETNDKWINLCQFCLDIGYQCLVSSLYTLESHYCLWNIYNKITITTRYLNLTSVQTIENYLF